MEKILTVIIPTYNMEEYLPRCLDSLITYDKEEEIEVLIINDGSKDHSSEIGHKYESDYPNIFKVIDKNNGNYGSCINVGLKNATGKYVKILDSDDYFETSSLRNVIRRLHNTDSDAILTNFSTCKGDERIEQNYFYQDNSILNVENEPLCELHMHGIMFKLSMLKEHSYNQTEGISYTDKEWIFYPFFYIKTISYFSENLYQYVLGRDGQTVDEKVFTKRIFMVEKIVSRMILYSKDHLSVCTRYRKEYLTQMMRSLIIMIYNRELIVKPRKECSLVTLREMDNKLKLYNPNLSNEFEHPFYTRLHIILFRKGVLLPDYLRTIFYWILKLKNKE